MGRCRRRNRRKKRGWIGAVVLLIIFAAVTCVFINMFVNNDGNEPVNETLPTAFNSSRPAYTHEKKSSDISPEATQEINAQNDSYSSYW